MANAQALMDFGSYPTGVSYAKVLSMDSDDGADVTTSALIN